MYYHISVLAYQPEDGQNLHLPRMVVCTPGLRLLVYVFHFSICTYE